MNNKLPQFRQGDVLVHRIASIPTDAVFVANTSRIIIAHGEVTGHAHALDVAECEEYTLTDAKGEVTRFLRALAAHPATQAPILAKGPNGTLLDMPTGPTMFAACDLLDGGDVATPLAPYARQVHEEHYAHGLLAGDYMVNAPQREYTPESIRNVAD